MRVLTWARASGGAAASNTDGRGFDTSRACSYAPDNQSGHQHFDNCRGIVIGAISTMTPQWVGRAMGAADGKPAVIPTEGVRFLPGPRRASRLTGGAPGPQPGRVRNPGRARSRKTSRRSSDSGSAGPSSGGRGCESRRWRHVDVAEWTKAPAYEAGDCRFDPCRRRAQLAVARVDGHRPPEAGLEAPGRSSRPASATRTRRDRQADMTPGPRPGRRDSTPRPGT